MRKSDSLERYRAKRDFTVTPEPAAGGRVVEGALQFVVQKHWASRLHYDFRLELAGTMKSWAVPKGPSFDPHDKRMAVHVEDHPISYNSFEGQIPAKQYGAGKVIIWDRGLWTPLEDPRKGYAKGRLKFTLQGHKLRGNWALIRIRGDRKQDVWLLIKEKDDFVRPSGEFSVVDEMPDSVASLSEVAQARMPKVKAAKVRKGSRPSGAVKRSSPSTLKPELATLADAPPANTADWIYEVKFDGYRMLAKIEPKQVRLVTRNGHDWTDKVPHLAKALKSMKLKPGWLDGECVIVKDQERTSFQDLQNAFDSARTKDIVYYLFDVPFYDGYDLTRVPLVERQELLQGLLEDAPDPIRFSEAFDAKPTDLLASACKLGLEGIIAKRKASLYTSRRTRDWLKLKCSQRQEFVIGGWTDPAGSRKGLGALLLGIHDDKGKLTYAGKVGTGFTASSLRTVSGKLESLAAKESPFAAKVPEASRAHWVKPRLLAEVSFSEWTGDGHVRHPVFHALRSDKPAKAIVRERPTSLAKVTPDTTPPSKIPASLKVTHGERVVDASTGTTKLQIVRYYALVGELMMPFLKGRRVSLVKAPQGLDRPTFFQKHLQNTRMDGIEELEPDPLSDNDRFLEVARPIGLLSAAQMNVIEFHTWNATKKALEKPDRMNFDLDPGKGVDWATLQQAAELMRGFLEQLGLPAYLKTSGGKGLHVVTPLKPQYDWDTVKDFSQAVVVHMAKSLPKLFVAVSGPRNRVGKIFIDYLRNGRGATTAEAWTARARPGLGISVPVAWEELGKLKSSDQWTVANAHARLDVGNSPWADYSKAAARLGAAMKTLGFAPP